MSESEVARIRQQIAAEYQSVQRVFEDFTPTGKHEFLTKRQENIARHFEELTQHMSREEAMETMIQLSSGDGNKGAL